MTIKFELTDEEAELYEAIAKLRPKGLSLEEFNKTLLLRGLNELVRRYRKGK